MKRESLWTMGIPSTMQWAGKSCQTVINGKNLFFTGILDAAEVTEEGDMGSYTKMDSVIRINKQIAMILKDIVNQEVKIDGVRYIMNTPIFEDDGETAICPVYPYEPGKRV